MHFQFSVLAPNAEVCSCTISQNINGCNCNVTKDSDQQFLLLETSTDNSPHQEFRMHTFVLI